MMEMNMSEWLELADELGIEYELDSDNPGLFIEENGTEREVTVFELFGIEDFEEEKCEEKQNFTYSISFERTVSKSVVKKAASKKTFDKVNLGHHTFVVSDDVPVPAA